MPQPSFLFEATLFGENSWMFNMPIFGLVILAGLELLNVLITMLFSSAKSIPIKGKHLDKLETIDNAFIITNKLVTVVFVYHLFTVSSIIHFTYLII